MVGDDLSACELFSLALLSNGGIHLANLFVSLFFVEAEQLHGSLLILGAICEHDVKFALLIGQNFGVGLKNANNFLVRRK